MASHSLTRPVAGVRLPGLGRLRFCEAATPDLPLHSWVAVPSPLGEEPGLIVVSPQQIALGELPPSLPQVGRLLTAREVAGLAALTQRAREHLDVAIGAVRGTALPVFVTGLRLTLTGDGLLLTWRGPHDQAEQLEQRLTATLALPIDLAWEGPLTQAGDHLFGGVGRLRGVSLDTDDLLRERFAVPGGPGIVAPEGLPRLGARVQTPEGAGSLHAVSLRHREATVRLDTGVDIRVPLESLVAIPGSEDAPSARDA